MTNHRPMSHQLTHSLPLPSYLVS